MVGFVNKLFFKVHQAFLRCPGLANRSQIRRGPDMNLKFHQSHSGGDNEESGVSLHCLGPAILSVYQLLSIK